MLKALEGYGGSYLGIWEMLPFLANDLEQNPSIIPASKMIEALRSVLLTWERGDLPLSERLVTALAQSLVTQDGFNIDQPGNHTDMCGMYALALSRQMVMITGSWFRDNLERSNEHLDREIKQLNIKMLQEGVAVDEIVPAGDRLDAAGVELQTALDDAREDEQELEELVFQMEARNAELEEEAELMQFLADGLDRIWDTMRKAGGAASDEE